MHRVNSVEKLLEVENHYSGVELDIEWKHGKFDVNHPPKETIGLTLFNYLRSSKRSDSLGFWLDFKYLKAPFSDSAVGRLNEICNQLNLSKNQFIIESNNPNALLSFSKNGYQTSYYVPSQMHTKDSLKLYKTLKIISKNSNLDSNMYLSSNYKDYNILKTYFPKREFLFWHTGNRGGMTKEQLDEIVDNILEDEQVKVLLETHKSVYDR